MQSPSGCEIRDALWPSHEWLSCALAFPGLGVGVRFETLQMGCNLGPFGRMVETLRVGQCL